MYSKLQKELELRGMTKYRLAKLSSVPLSDMYAIFKGKRPLFPAWKKRICDALQMDEEDLFPEDGECNEAK